MEIFAKINHLVLELYHAFAVETFVFEAHLLFHEEDSIDGLVLLVVLLEFEGELVGLAYELFDGFRIRSLLVDDHYGGLIEIQILLEVVEVVILFVAFPFEELDLVLLGLVGNEYLLDVADVAVFHCIWIIVGSNHKI